MERFDFIIVVIVLTVSLLVRCLLFLGVEMDMMSPFTLTLHLAVSIAMYGVGQKLKKKKVDLLSNTSDYFKTMVGAGPNWLLIPSMLIYLYCSLDFILLWVSSVSEKHYVLLEQGEFIREISDKEFSAHKSIMWVRGLSDIWIMSCVYGLSILYPKADTLKE